MYVTQIYLELQFVVVFTIAKRFTVLTRPLGSLKTEPRTY